MSAFCLLYFMFDSPQFVIVARFYIHFYVICYIVQSWNAQIFVLLLFLSSVLTVLLNSSVIKDMFHYSDVYNHQ